MLSNILASLILLWPAILLLFLIGFGCLVFGVFLVSSTVILFSIFIYGLYSILKDLGLLDWLLSRLGTLSSLLSDHVKKNVEDSFVFETENEEVLPPSKPALYLCHPHGLYGITWFIHFAICLSKWPFEKRPVLAVHSIFFQLPVLRELFKAHRCIEATEKEIEKALEQGDSVALLVGGIEELHLTEAGKLNLVLKKREGYARVAHKTQVPLIPVISPKENDLFPPTSMWIWRKIQEFLYSSFRIAAPLPSFESLSSWLTISYKPFKNPLVTYIGKPLYTDGKSIQEIQSEYRKLVEEFAEKKNILLEWAA
jgi:hypothetical protein